MKLEHEQLDGSVALVGAGPGDPELLTMRAARLLAAADVVLYDHLVDSQILELCHPDANYVFVGKVPDGPRTPQGRINELLVAFALDGHFVVRLKGGDPFVFGRGGEEGIALAEYNIPFEVVPGISSCIAVPASAGIPVTHRGVTTHFSVVTGFGATTQRELEQTWGHLGRAGGTLVFLMGVRRLDRIVEVLLANERSADTPVALVRAGTTASQETCQATLGTIVDRAREQGITSPATFIVGEVVSLRDILDQPQVRAHLATRVAV